jgi:uncharacterized protein YfeS
MELYVMAKSYNGYGVHTSISPVLSFLLQGTSGFGDAINELSVTLHFATAGPAEKTLESHHDDHHRNRKTLPKVVFRRARGQMCIDIASDLMDGDDWKPSPLLSLPIFAGAVEEVIGALTLMKKRLKPSDAFDLEGFLTHCNEARKLIPATSEELQILGAHLQAAKEAKRNAMPPWDKIEIEWDKLHPEAREILDDPFFWDCGDDFSPNGNDTGADLLTEYSKWVKRNKHGDPMVFLQQLAIRWGYTDLDSMDALIRDEAAIALAFAEIKLRASCNAEARDFAVKAIHRQRREAHSSSEWVHRDERLTKLNLLETKLA